MAERKTYRNYVGGEWVNASTGKTFENRNPADQEDLVGVFQDSGAEDVDRAVEAARVAYDPWRLMPAPKRAEKIFALARWLEENKEALAADETREMGKVLMETRGDVQEGIDIAYYMAGEGRRLFGHTVPSELPDKFAMSVRMPLGVCGLITPWNFPLAIPCWKTMPALVCGNTVVIKPATDTPLTVLNLARGCEAVGIPPGVFNVVTGSGSRVGEPLTRHPDVKVISFTGSTEVGRRVNQACAPDFRHVCLEMGGKNVTLVMEDADLGNAVDGTVWGAFGTTGQRCTATSRIVIHERVYEPFVKAFIARARSIRVGNGADGSVEMGPLINRAQMETVASYIRVGQEEGAVLLAGGNRVTGGAHDRGWFLQPTVFGDVTPSMRIAREEIFGPVASLLRCRDLEEGIAIANDTVYGLSASIYTNDLECAFRAMRDVYTGIFYVNSATIGAEVHLPFGGTNQTGNGHREAGQAALDTFSEWKAVYVDFSGKLQRAQIDTN